MARLLWFVWSLWLVVEISLMTSGRQCSSNEGSEGSGGTFSVAEPLRSLRLAHAGLMV